MPGIEIVVGDLFAQEADAIVNPANEQLAHAGGVARLIARRAGPEWERASRRLAPLPAGSAALDGAGDLPHRHVIHVVGPRWQGGDRGEPELLATAHRAVVEAARAAGLASVAMPAISTGIFGYPPEAAAPVAVGALREALAPASAITVSICFLDAEVAAPYRDALDERSGRRSGPSPRAR